MSFICYRHCQTLASNAYINNMLRKHSSSVCIQHACCIHSDPTANFTLHLTHVSGNKTWSGITDAIFFAQAVLKANPLYCRKSSLHVYPMTPLNRLYCRNIQRENGLGRVGLMHQQCVLLHVGDHITTSSENPVCEWLKDRMRSHNPVIGWMAVKCVK